MDPVTEPGEADLGCPELADHLACGLPDRPTTAGRSLQSILDNGHAVSDRPTMMLIDTQNPGGDRRVQGRPGTGSCPRSQSARWCRAMVDRADQHCVHQLADLDRGQLAGERQIDGLPKGGTPHQFVNPVAAQSQLVRFNVRNRCIPVQISHCHSLDSPIIRLLHHERALHDAQILQNLFRPAGELAKRIDDVRPDLY